MKEKHSLGDAVKTLAGPRYPRFAVADVWKGGYASRR